MASSGGLPRTALPTWRVRAGNTWWCMRDLDMVAVITGRGDTPDIDYHGLFRLVSEGVTGAVAARRPRSATR